MMSENMQIALMAINKWLFFGWNYDTVFHRWTDIHGEIREMNLPQFLVDAKWTCNLDHMLEKWQGATKIRNTDAYLVSFYAQLDQNNRIILLEWVMTHYRTEKKLF